MNSLVDLLMAFRAGAEDMSARGTLLNDINVYPVVDGDTGTNMEASLLGALQLASAADSSSASRSLLGEIAVSLIEGGRGNSGVILTSCLAGFFDSLKEADTLCAKSFVKAVRAGSDLAYRSVQKPVEGTILTAMRGLSDYLEDHHGDWMHADVIATSERMAALVAETKTMLPKLAAADVVDSGALGFHILASGMILYLPCSGPDAHLAQREIQQRLDGSSHLELKDIKTAISERYLQTNDLDKNDWSYCVTALLGSAVASNDQIYQACEPLGGSIDVSRLGDVAKIHLHTNDLDGARTQVERLGCLREFNYEKMSIARAPSENENALIERKTQIRVVTDASASISSDIALEYGLKRLQTYVSGHGQTLKDDDVDLPSLFAGMKEGHIYKTAHTSPKEAQSFLDSQLSLCEHLVYVAVGNAYSGTQKVFRDAASKHPESTRISIVDSRAASGQLALACIAASLHAHDKPSDDGVLDYVRDQVNQCREYLVIDDLKHLARGGRIGKVKASLAGFLSIKPIVGHGDNGAITYAKARSHEAAFAEVFSRIKQHPGDGPLALLLQYTDNKEWIETLKLKIRRELPSDTLYYLAPLSPSSAVHMGPGTWGIAVTRL